MKTVSFIGEFDDVKGEGLVSVVRALKENLEKEYNVLLNKYKGIKQIHSNGLFLVVKKYSILNDSYLFLYGNINEDFYFRLRNIIRYYLYFNNQHHNFLRALRSDFFTLLAGLTPLFIKRYLLKKAKKIIVPTNYLKEKINLRNVEVIPLGVDVKKFRKIEGKINKFVVAFFGHNSPLKGIEEFIKAAGILKKEDIEFRMYLTKHSERTEEYAKKYNNKIKVFGYVEDIVKKYNECNIIVLPYQTSTSAIAIPLTLIEAMACQVPIITTKLPHIVEIVRDGAVLAPRVNPKKIAEKILLLKKNPELRKKLGLRAREIVKKEYSLEKMCFAHKKFLSTLSY